MHISEIVSKASQLGASDVHIGYGLPLCGRLHGVLTRIGDTSLSHEDCENYGRYLAEDEFDMLLNGGEIDIARTISGIRVRINLFRQQGHVSVALRLLSDKIPQLTDLGLPQAALEFVKLRQGIVLITGETGSGKSTTLAALLDKINRTRTDHILTLEDPIEYIHSPDKCIVNQREIGRDTDSFANGLRSALREDPDVILIGEMRDLITIETAITAAETGHLVFATLHTISAADSIDRIVDVFPEARQKQIRMQLSMTLRAVVSQQLIPTADKRGRALACELMIVNSAIRNLIREGKTPMIHNAVATSAAEGAVTMDNSLIKLVRERKISSATAVERAYDADTVRKAVGGGERRPYA